MVDENVAHEPVSIDGGRGGGASVVRGAGSARNGESWRFGKIEEFDFRRENRRERVGPGWEDAAALCGWVWARVVREVFVGTLGTLFGIEGADEDVTGLADRIQADGLTLGAGMGLLVFFALAMQCLSTLAVLRKETGGWRWPAWVFTYMTVLAWVAALLVYQGGLLLGFQ